MSSREIRIPDSQLKHGCTVLECMRTELVTKATLLRKKLSRKSGRWMLPIGLIAVSLGIVLSRFVRPHANALDFTEGFLLGLGIVFLLASIALRSGDRTQLHQ